MKILISNDDGIKSEGIRALAESLLHIGHVTVVAPDVERSATGHAITLHQPLRVSEVDLKLNVPCYAVDGTPADCVKIAIDRIMSEKPDIVFSGINRGANLGTDVLYSGTVSAAMEGAILGCPSIAVSLASFDNNVYGYAGEIARNIAEEMTASGLDSGKLLNINVPNIPKAKIRGLKVTALGVRKYNDHYIERKDPRGKSYFWLAGGALDNEDDEENWDTDIYWLNKGYVTVTPIHYNLTKHDLINNLKTWEF